MKINSLPPLSFLLITVIGCNQKKEATTLNYPEAKKVDTVDFYFGEKVTDPYRWLENDTSKETAEWVKAENEITSAYLKGISYKDRVQRRLEEIINYPRLTAPFKEGDYYYFYKNDGLQNQNILYRKKTLEEKGEVFLNPNTFSKDGTTRLAGTYFSKDGSLLACLISEGGSDWRKGIVIRTTDKSVVQDTLRNIKFSGIAWKGNEGFYYSVYDQPEGNQLFSKLNFNKLYYHRLGTSQQEDEIIFDGNRKPQRRVGAYTTEDEKYLVITTSVSTTGNELYVKDLDDPDSEIIPLVTNFDHNFYVVGNEGSTLFVETNLHAPHYRIAAADLSEPEVENWKDLIPEAPEAIENVSTAGKKLFVNYLKDAHTLIRQFDYSGNQEREIPLPQIGTARGFAGRQEDKEVFYSFTSFTYPTTIFRYDIASGKSGVYEKPEVDFSPDDYETIQVFYKSKDSTTIPMFIVYKKGMERNSKNPTWLYAYGGFNISLTPSFSASRIVWLENGGIYAQPSLRGGGEYGEQWHLAGTKMNKQNVFDDFIAAGEYLIREKYTASKYLAIAGGSNGGLLIGATITQRPDLAKVAFPAVGVMDMLRYHKFTIGAAWAYDYGTSEDSKEMFEYLKKYSPLHALKPGISYPATMVTTADHDDRVVPAHSFKFAATLQEDQAGESPVLIRIETKSGHGSSNLKKALEVIADEYSFAWYNMGIVPPLAKEEM